MSASHYAAAANTRRKASKAEAAELVSRILTWRALLISIRLLRRMMTKAVDLLSGPGGLASFLRRRQLGARLAGPSLPLDIGYAETIPAGSATRSPCGTSTAGGPTVATSPPVHVRSTTSSTRRTAARPAPETVFYFVSYADIGIRNIWAIHLSGPDENRPLDTVVMAARRTKILRLVRLTEYPLETLCRPGDYAALPPGRSCLRSSRAFGLFF